MCDKVDRVEEFRLSGTGNPIECCALKNTHSGFQAVTGTAIFISHQPVPAANVQHPGSHS